MTLPAEPVREWLQLSLLSDRELAALCASRAGTVEGWRKWLQRLPRFETVSVYNVDVLCTVLGEHLSRFDPMYQEVA